MRVSEEQCAALPRLPNAPINAHRAVSAKHSMTQCPCPRNTSHVRACCTSSAGLNNRVRAQASCTLLSMGLTHHLHTVWLCTTSLPAQCEHVYGGAVASGIAVHQTLSTSNLISDPGEHSSSSPTTIPLLEHRVSVLSQPCPEHSPLPECEGWRVDWAV
jgi:hypothetical protein